MIKFACDDMVGRLARWLRILGYDTSYDAALAESEFVKRAVRESRLVLTRDGGLSGRWTLPSCLHLEGERTYDQLRQVISELNLPITDYKIFTLCLKCNKPLGEIHKGEARGRVPAFVYRTKDHFFSCPDCGRLYWRGTHHDLVRGIIAHVLERKNDSGENSSAQEGRSGA